MRITKELLLQHGACEDQINLFVSLYPSGAELTVDNALQGHRHGLDALWLLNLLPAEGPHSQRAFTLWCAEQVVHLCDDYRVAACIETVRCRVARLDSVTDEDMRAACDAALDAADAAADAAARSAAAGARAAGAVRAAAEAAAEAAALAAARAAVGDAARDVAVAAQIACLVDLLRWQA